MVIDGVPIANWQGQELEGHSTLVTLLRGEWIYDNSYVFWDEDQGQQVEIFGEYVEGGLEYDISSYGTYYVYVDNELVFSVFNSWL